MKSPPGYGNNLFIFTKTKKDFAHLASGQNEQSLFDAFSSKTKVSAAKKPVSCLTFPYFPSNAGISISISNVEIDPPRSSFTCTLS